MQANTAVYASSPPATLPSVSTSLTAYVNNTDGPSILYVDGEYPALMGQLPSALLGSCLRRFASGALRCRAVVACRSLGRGPGPCACW